MKDIWYAYAEDDVKDALSSSLLERHPNAEILFATSASKLRRTLLKRPGEYSAVIGPAGSDISSVNAAAAIVSDASAQLVALVCKQATGSLRSRAMRAGIDEVIELSEQRAVREALPVVPADAQKKRLAAVTELPNTDDLEEPEFIQGRHVSQGHPRTHTRDGAPILCVGSGRGGVGKTVLCGAMAQAAASWGMRVALLDFDLGLGNLHSYLGQNRPHDLSRLAHRETLEPEDINALSLKVEESLELWGPCELPELAETLGERAGELLDYLSNTHDLVIVDTSTTCTDTVAQAFQSCDRLLLVTDGRSAAPGPISRMAALAVRLGVPRTRIVRVMNRSDDYDRKKDLSYHAARGLEAARSFNLPDEADDLIELLGSGKLLELETELPELAKSISFLVASVLSELGRLPDNEAAQKALGLKTKKRRRLFARMREAS